MIELQPNEEKRLCLKLIKETIEVALQMVSGNRKMVILKYLSEAVL
jgi:hypothetical protein